MDLQSGYPFSLIRSGLPYEYPKLDEDLKTDVVIIGGGISGALVAYHLIKEGIDCILVERRTVGLGSTCASTSLLQYELDVPLEKLIRLKGHYAAVQAYNLCKDSINKLRLIASSIRFPYFQLKPSLHYTARIEHHAKLYEEFLARKENGFRVEWLEKRDLKSGFGFSASGAILSEDGAEADAYLLTHALLQSSIRKGLTVYDRTPIIKIDHRKNGVVLKSENERTIRAKKIVYAVGYEVVKYITRKIVNLQSTYSTVSETFPEGKRIFKRDSLMWSTGDIYLYMRTTSDNRIMIGGRDVPYYNPLKRDHLIKRKSSLLVRDFKELFPGIEFKPEFSWTGTFGTTDDGLPFIGTYPGLPHSYFALGFGGNGITFSLIAAEIIRDIFLRKRNPDIDLFSFNRI